MIDLPAETRDTIIHILELEIQTNPDWDVITAICDAEIARINENGLGAIINGLPYQFLEDSDIRRKDNVYGEHQRSDIRDFLKLTT